MSNDNSGRTQGFYSGITNHPEDVVYEEMLPTRPISITIICVIIALSIILNLFQLPGYANDSSLPSWFMPFTLFSLLLVIGSVVGLWMMKKWGAWLYTANFLITAVLLVAVGGSLAISYIVVPLIVQAFIYRKYSEML